MQQPWFEPQDQRTMQNSARKQNQNGITGFPDNLPARPFAGQRPPVSPNNRLFFLYNFVLYYKYWHFLYQLKFNMSCKQPRRLTFHA